jgi:hypothetical protein
MRRVRIALGLVAALCAFGTFAAPALAKKEVKEVVFGKFTASYPFGPEITPSAPATAAGVGEIFSLNLAKGALQITTCSKALKSSGPVTSQSSDTILQNITFNGCKAKVKLNKEITEEIPVPKFTIGMEFYSKGSAIVGQPAEVKIVKPSTVTIQIGKHAACSVTLPAQTIPTKAEVKPNQEYEAAFYETEFEEANVKKFPSGFQEKLDIEMEFAKVESWVKPNEHCIYGPGEEGAFDNEEGTPAFGYVVYTKGTLEAEIEEISIKHGNLGFEPKKEEEI